MKKPLVCQACGNDDQTKFVHVEQITELRRVAHFTDGVMHMEEPEVCDEGGGTDSHFECYVTKPNGALCGARIEWPEGLEVEW